MSVNYKNPGWFDLLKTLRFLLVYHDDSSLFVARAAADDLIARGHHADMMRIELDRDSTRRLSPRQEREGLGPHSLVCRRSIAGAFDEHLFSQYDSIVSAKFPVPFRVRSARRAWRFRKRRPCFVTLFPGMEFFPERGYNIRGYFDVISFNTEEDRKRYDNSVPSHAPAHQRKCVYQPAFVHRQATSDKKRDEIVFFAQSVTPAGRDGRKEILKFLASVRRKMPDFKIVIKLRHLETENLLHTHVENYSYQELAADMGYSEIFEFRTGPVSSAFDRAAAAITCSSTAGIEALAVGVPTMFLTGFSGWEQDEISIRARRLLAPSGLLADIKCDCDLAFGLGREEWNRTTFYGLEAVDQLVSKVMQFHEAPPDDLGILSNLRGLARTAAEISNVLEKNYIRPIFR
jgi:predicted SnoaL-like aldol condensation-catalyzing enzyme